MFNEVTSDRMHVKKCINSKIRLDVSHILCACMRGGYSVRL